jgi:micrococcal nuclease
VRFLALLLLSTLPLFADFGRVVSVSDGDTITVLTDQKEQIKIRLWGIDAPEAKQAYGSKAREELAGLVAGKRVEYDPKQKDRYGRIVSKVSVNGKDAGGEMLRKGFAWWYREYAKKAEYYQKLEQEAREARRGLWKDKEPIPPWEFRKKK